VKVVYKVEGRISSLMQFFPLRKPYSLRGNHESGRDRETIGDGIYNIYFPANWGTAVAQWLRRCATNRKVAGSIPDGVIGLFIDIKSFRSHYGPEVDSASNRNEYQEYFLGVKAAGA